MLAISLAHIACTSDTGSDGDTGGVADSADTADSADSGADSRTDSGDDTGVENTVDTRLLDACVTDGKELTELWSSALPDMVGTPTQMAWARDHLVVLDADGTTDATALRAYDLPAPLGDSSALGTRWQSVGSTLGFSISGTKVFTANGGIHVLNLADAAELASVDLGASPALSVAGSGDAAFATTATEVFTWDGASSSATPSDVGDAAGQVVGMTVEGEWAAGEGRAPVVAFRARGESAFTSTTLTAFGRAVDILPHPGGGAWVFGGPDGYAWYGSFDGTGTLVASNQFESPGISRVVGSEGTQHAWSSWDGLGIAAFSDTNYGILSDTPSIAALAVDPDGYWLLTVDEDGTLRRWTCEE
ncbi:hypothetical protein LBMAG42_37140 [Deltaproteobacteria bacterium]|nr:hypothetical protein LBMAG42_37140 [Deltaproteobacteria bacterium]